MKRILAIVALFLPVASVTLFAEDIKPKVPIEICSTTSQTVEQRFREVDIKLAIAQYEKLQMSAFELRLKVQLDAPANEIQKDELAKRAEILRNEASELRESTIKRASAAPAPTR
jgi:hypothetical protein